MTKNNADTTTVQSQTLTSKGGTTISYQTTGTGPPVIVITGVLSVAANSAGLGPGPRGRSGDIALPLKVPV